MSLLPVIASLILAGQPQFSMSDAQTGQLWNCHVAEKQLKVLGEAEHYNLGGRDVLMYRLSRKHGAQDMILIYETRNGKPLPFPHYYIYDMDLDSQPDTAYADMHGNGLCTQMQQVPVETALGKGEKRL